MVELLAVVALCTGVVGAGIGCLWLLGVTLGESVAWGLTCVVLRSMASIPFATLYWAKAWRPLLVFAASLVLLVAGASGGLRRGMDVCFPHLGPLDDHLPVGLGACDVEATGRFPTWPQRPGRPR